MNIVGGFAKLELQWFISGFLRTIICLRTNMNVRLCHSDLLHVSFYSHCCF